MQQHDDPASLADIVDAARLSLSFVAGVDKASFLENLLIQSAVIRQIEVMGEAVKRLSDGFRAANPQVPWKKIAGMRDLLIHAYDHVDPEEVWNALEISIPELLNQLTQLLPEDIDL